MKVLAAADGLSCPVRMNHIRGLCPADLCLQMSGWDPDLTGWSYAAPGSILDLAGHRVLVAPEAGQLCQMAAEARDLGCDVLIRPGRYVAWCVELEGVLVVDPGSVRHSGNRMPPSCAFLDLVPGQGPLCTIHWLKAVPDGLESSFQTGVRQRGEGKPQA